MKNFAALFALVTVVGSVIAAPVSKQMTFDQYYQADCQSYTGTWQGFITDPSDLFDNGGPWPITINLYEKNGQIVGRSSQIKNKAGKQILPAKKIWANCQAGVMTQIIWGEKGECGGEAPRAMLLSQKALALPLAWENAMNGTTFLTFLQKTSQQYPYPVPALEDFNYGKRETCH